MELNALGIEKDTFKIILLLFVVFIFLPTGAVASYFEDKRLEKFGKM
jgi:hypothetical protein